MQDPKTSTGIPGNRQTREGYYNSYKKQSIERRDKEFTLSLEQFWTLKEQPCFYCGEPGINGIDRLYSDKGYTPTNSVSCCYDCNSLKRDVKFPDYINRCIRIAEKHKYRTFC